MIEYKKNLVGFKPTRFEYLKIILTKCRNFEFLNP